MFGLDAKTDGPSDTAPTPSAAEPTELVERLPASHLPRTELMSHVGSMPSTGFARDEDDDRFAAQQLAQQNMAFRQQDTHLDHLSASISRQHELSLRMNEELELHTDLLHELDRDVDDTGLRLGGASDRLERFRRSVKEHGRSRCSRRLRMGHLRANFRVGPTHFAIQVAGYHASVSGQHWIIPPTYQEFNKRMA